MKHHTHYQNRKNTNPRFHSTSASHVHTALFRQQKIHRKRACTGRVQIVDSTRLREHSTTAGRTQVVGGGAHVLHAEEVVRQLTTSPREDGVLFLSERPTFLANRSLRLCQMGLKNMKPILSTSALAFSRQSSSPRVGYRLVFAIPGFINLPWGGGGATTITHKFVWVLAKH